MQANTQLPRDMPCHGARIIVLGNRHHSRRYCWRQCDGPWPGESLWSLMQCFCMRNGLTGGHFLRILRSNNTRISKVCSPYRPIDWRILTPDTVNRLAELVGSTADNLSMGHLHGYFGGIPHRALNELAAPHLRRCRECTSIGYHGFFHQLRLLDFCPLHPDQRLTTRCDCCGAESPYGSPHGNYPDACYQCGRSLISPENRKSLTGVRFSEANALMDQFRAHRSKGLNLAASFLGSASNSKMSNTSRSIHGRRLGLYLATAAGDHDTPDRGAVSHAMVRYNIHALQDQPLRPHENTASLRSIYKTISRRIRKILLKNSSGSLKLACIAIRIKSVAFPHPPFASRDCYAFINWRMFWEQADIPAGLYCRPWGGAHRWEHKIYGTFVENFSWNTSDIRIHEARNAVMERIFAMTCMATFFRLLLTYRQSFTSSPYEWRYCDVSLHDGPFYIIQQNGAETALHWFMDSTTIHSQTLLSLTR